MDRVTVLLAVPSALYAPLYLAKMIGKGFQDVDFEYAGAPRGNYDPLIDGVLSTVGKRRTVLAVGDPMRIISTARLDIYDRPVVVGTMITKMCYWALDRETVVEEDAPYWSSIRRIVSNPNGMTAYALLFYDLIRNGAFGSSLGKTETYNAVDKYILDVQPGYEKQFYDALQKARRGRDRREFGYLTTDPLEYHASSRRSYRPIRSFGRHSTYSDVAMTGLITGQTLWEQQQSRLEALREGMAQAIAFMNSDPSYAAVLLQRYHDQRIQFDRWTLEEIDDCICELCEQRTYSVDLRVTKAQVENSKKIRQPAEEFLLRGMTPKVRETRSERLNGVEEFFLLDSPVTPCAVNHKSISSAFVIALQKHEQVRTATETHSGQLALLFRAVIAPILLGSATVFQDLGLENAVFHTGIAPDVSDGLTLYRRILVSALTLGGGVLPCLEVEQTISGRRLGAIAAFWSTALTSWAVYLLINTWFGPTWAITVTAGLFIALAGVLWKHYRRLPDARRSRLTFKARLREWWQFRRDLKRIKRRVG